MLFIEDARRKAREHGVEDRVEFVVCDAKELSSVFEEASFDAVVNVWTTILGYGTREDDLKVLKEARAVTRAGGLLLIVNTASHDLAALRHSIIGSPKYIEEVDEELLFIEEPRFDPASSIVTNRWTFYRREGKNLIYVDQVEFRIRLYALHELVELAEQAGWKLPRSLWRCQGCTAIQAGTTRYQRGIPGSRALNTIGVPESVGGGCFHHFIGSLKDPHPAMTQRGGGRKAFSLHALWRLSAIGMLFTPLLYSLPIPRQRPWGGVCWLGFHHACS